MSVCGHKFNHLYIYNIILLYRRFLKSLIFLFITLLIIVIKARVIIVKACEFD